MKMSNLSSGEMARVALAVDMAYRSSSGQPRRSSWTSAPPTSTRTSPRRSSTQSRTTSGQDGDRDMPPGGRGTFRRGHRSGDARERVRKV
uniref:Uncharacterized protein n=1 Tax=Diadromus pulchellus ascovirus 4a TaxID=158683 RepID=Q9DSU8_9VIRU|nr:hypothetical protein [Diadromus pulchellus ascovirus 4a]